jgi:glycine cleavage system aminomethyltransferase T/glycine/D-amino acid oxidase-like deaminating enzyme
MEKEAKLVIIGAGIVGVSTAYHLAELGWKDIVVLDKGPLFHTGGSTSHAPGLVFQTNGSKTMCKFARQTVELLNSLHTKEKPTFYQVGGIEVAYTMQRLQDLHRRWGWGQAYGLNSSLLTPEEVQAQIPVLDHSVIKGGLYIPSDGDALAVNAVEALAEITMEKGAAVYYGDTEVTGFKTNNNRVTEVLTDQGSIKAESVLLATNIWGPVLSDQLDVKLPLMAVEHQYLISDPLESLQGEEREIVHPILRHQDFSMYFRQHGDAYGIGSYKHEPLLVDPYQVGKDAMRPFTKDDFQTAGSAAKELIPELRGKNYATTFNGMFAFTIDGYPILGKPVHLDNFWTAIGVWVTHSGGVGKAVAEWMDSGRPAIDLAAMDVNRFSDYMTTKTYLTRTAAQQYREVYDIIHPKQQMEHTREIRLSPYHQQLKVLEGEFFESVGWERPQWYRTNQSLLTQYRDQIPERDEWSSRFWSPIQGAEHLAAREKAALFELSSFFKIEVSGPEAAEFVEKISANRVLRGEGKIVYTALLNERGTFQSDLTITQVGRDRFWILTGGGSGETDLAWISEQAPPDARLKIKDLTSEYTAVGLWGPRARKILGAVTSQDISNQAFPYLTARKIDIETIPALAFRISYIGELGWEIYAPAEFGSRLWKTLWEAGQDQELIAAGMGAFESLRLEKGYRALGAELTAEQNPFQAGLGWAVDLDQEDFLGKEALVQFRKSKPEPVLCCLTLEEGTPLGKEPVLDGDRVLGYLTSTDYGYSIGKQIAYAYLPVEYAAPGRKVEVDYQGRRLPAVVEDDPLYDPQMEKLTR